jgi:hypothetical protein
MNRHTLPACSLILITLFLISCNKPASRGKSETKKTAKLTKLSNNGITLTEFYAPESFDDATLTQEFISDAAELDDNKVTVEFKATNYEFGKQTSMEGIKSCANAPGGQHVHFIIDNQPYLALYKEKETVNTQTDGQHIVLSFLSRSYHESIKNKNAYVLTSVITGKSRYVARYAAPDIEKPMLFFSRPKGEYKGGETDAVLLDFYLVNCDLSEKGYKVKAEVNGTVFILTKWTGYFMEGLPMGENKIKLTLLDEKGNAVDSPYNGTERKITLKQE